MFRAIPGFYTSPLNHCVSLKCILAGVTILWAKALGNAIIHGFALLMGVTLLLPPATILRAIVQEEVSTYTFLGRSSVAVVICAMVKLDS